MTLSKKIIFLISVCFVAYCSNRNTDTDDSLEASSNIFELTSPSQITAGNESNFSPDLSSDGLFIVFTSDKKVNKDIWKKRASGGFAHALTTHSADDFSPILSPTSSDVAFVSRRLDAAGNIHILKSGYNISKMFSTGGVDISAIDSPSTEDTNPSWYPDGKKVVFSARRFSQKIPDIMTANIEDLKPQLLGKARGNQPSTSSNGEMVVYVNSGSIRIYHENTGDIEKITQGGIVQDGQPRFADDDKKLVFIRYLDDTNRDGRLNADDKPTLWSLDLENYRKGKIEKNSFSETPLTSASFASFSPQIRKGVLLFARQNNLGLDVFKLPAQGQLGEAKDLPSVTKLFDSLSDYNSKTFVLRKAASDFFRNGQLKLSSEISYKLMMWYVTNDRQIEARNLYYKITQNFKYHEMIIALSKIAIIELKLSPWMFPRVNRKPSDKELKILNLLKEELNSIEIEIEIEIENTYADADRNRPDSADKSEKGKRVELSFDDIDRITSEKILAKAKILASMRKLIESNNLIEKIIEKYKSQRKIVARAEMYSGYILAELIDNEAAKKKLINVIKDYSEQRTLIRRVSNAVVELVTKEPNPLKELAVLRVAYQNIPIFPAVIHLKIADIFEQDGKKLVASNELRQILLSYPKSPEIVLIAAKKLIKLMEEAGRVDELELLLFDMHDQFKEKNPTYSNQSKEILLSLLLRKGGVYTRKAEYESATTAYLTVTSIDKDNIAANRGMIDSAYSLERLSTVIKDLKEDYDDSPESAEKVYLYGYAKTFEIDESTDVSDRIAIIDDSIDIIENAREINGQDIHIHQTLGWLYFQKSYWTRKYQESGSIWSQIKYSSNLFVGFFGREEPNWLELSIDSFLSAYFLSEDETLERANIAQNLGNTYYENRNFPKALNYYMLRIKLLDRIPVVDPRAEGSLLNQAGRAAFHSGEMDLAASLQADALAVWERNNDDEMTSYALDRLALTLREMGKFKESKKLYKRLLRNQSIARQRKNYIKTSLNYGYVLYNLEEYDLALSYFALAERGIEGEDVFPSTVNEGDSESGSSIPKAAGDVSVQKSDRKISEKEIIDEEGGGGEKKSGGIQIALGGKSASHGFDKDGQLEMIAAFRAKIYEKINRMELAIAAQQAKSLLLENRLLIKEDKFAAEDLAISNNLLGTMALRYGDHEFSKNSFHKAIEFGKLLRPEGQKWMIKDEWINLINKSRIQLRLAQMGIITFDQLDKQISQIDHAIHNLREARANLGKGDGAPVARLISISGILKTYQKGGLTAQQLDGLSIGNLTKSSGLSLSGDTKTSEKDQGLTNPGVDTNYNNSRDIESGSESNNAFSSENFDSEKYGQESQAVELLGSDIENSSLPDFRTKSSSVDAENQANGTNGADTENQSYGNAAQNESPEAEIDKKGERKNKIPAGLKSQLVEAIDIIDAEKLARKDFYGSMFAWKGSVGDFKTSKKINQAHQGFRNEIIRNRSLSWKYAAATQDWKSAFNDYSHFIRIGGKASNPADLNSFRNVFEKLLGSSPDPSTQYRLIRLYQATVMLNMIRNTFDPKNFAKKPTVAAAKKVKNQNEKSTNGEPSDQKKKVLKIDPFASWVRLESSDSLENILSEGLAILSVHRTLDNQMYLFLQTEEGLKSSKFLLDKKSWENSDSVTNAIQEFGLEQLDISNLVIVPFAESFKLDWENILLSNGKTLTENFSISFVPQIDMVPKIWKKAKYANYFVGSIGSHPNSIAGNLSDSTEIKKVLFDIRKIDFGKSQTPKQLDSPLSLYHVIDGGISSLKLNSSRPGNIFWQFPIKETSDFPETLEKNPDGSTNTQQSNLAVHTTPKVSIDEGSMGEDGVQRKSGKTRILISVGTKTSTEIKIAAIDLKLLKPSINVSLDDLGQMNLENVSLIVFSDVDKMADPINDQFGGHLGWAALSFASLSSGVPSLVLPNSFAPNHRPVLESPNQLEDNKKIEESNSQTTSQNKHNRRLFFEKLGTGSISKAVGLSKVSARVIGHPGYSSEEISEALEDVVEELEEEAEEFEDEKKWREAALVYSSIYGLQIRSEEKDDANETLAQIRTSFFKAREYASALYFQIALADLAKASDDEEEYADLLIGAAGLATRAKKYKTSKRLLDISESYFKEEEDFEKLGKIARSRAIDFEKQKKYVKSIEFFGKAREFFQEEDDEKSAAQALLDQGNIYNTKLNNYKKSLEIYKEASDEFLEIGDKKAYVRIQIDRANALNKLGKPNRSIKILTKTLASMDQEKNLLPWIRTSQGLANGYYLAGQNRQAQDENDRTLEAVEEIENETKEANQQIEASNLKAMIFGKIGKYADAFEEFEEALFTADKYKLLQKRAMLLNNYGYWSREAGKINESISYLEEALEIDQELDLKKDIAFDQRNLAISIVVLGNFTRAKDLLRRSLKTSRKLGIAYNTLYCLFGLAEISFRNAEYDSASQLYKEAKKSAISSQQLDFVWKALAGLAKTSVAIKDGKSALNYYSEAIKRIELRRPGLRRDSSVTDMVSELGVQEIYESYIELLVQDKNFEIAWQVNESARKRQFLDSIASQKIKFHRPEISDLLDIELRYLDEVDLVSIELGQTQKSNSSKYGKIQRKFAILQNKLQKHRNETLERYPEVEEFFAVRPESLQTFLDAIPQGTAVIEYKLTEKSVIAWVMENGNLTSYVIGISKSKIRQMAVDFQQFVENYSSTSHIGNEFYTVFVAPLEKNIEGYERLKIIPDSWLYQVSFAAFEKDDQYLIEKYAISYEASASDALRRWKHSNRHSKPLKDPKSISILAFANAKTAGKKPIPFAAKEVRAIKRYYPSTKLVVGEKATKSKLKEEVGNYDFYHFAVHSEFDHVSPVESKLFFAGEGASSELSLPEIFSLGIKASLVTLSGCESGLGVISSGAETIGMNRAFSYSGVEGVISSLWRIDDVTSAVVMKRFYRYLSEGMSKASALRLAQLSSMKHFKHPAYWAAFKLDGI